MNVISTIRNVIGYSAMAVIIVMVFYSVFAVDLITPSPSQAQMNIESQNGNVS